MNTWIYWLCAVAVMALVTYIPRALPLSLVRRDIKSQFLRSFLYYLPFAVLGAMTFPSLLYATATPLSALFGMVTALVAAFLGAQLMPVALLSTAVAFITELIMRFMGLLK